MLKVFFCKSFKVGQLYQIRSFIENSVLDAPEHIVLRQRNRRLFLLRIDRQLRPIDLAPCVVRLGNSWLLRQLVHDFIDSFLYRLWQITVDALAMIAIKLRDERMKQRNQFRRSV